MRVRRRRVERQPQRQRRLLRPVISVGNLSVGGTGKSPVVAALAEWLIARGERPAILSRGYARANAADGVVVVSDGRTILATVGQSGDEELEDAFVSLIGDPVRRARLGAAARAVVEANRGAKEKSVTVLAALIPQEPRAYPANVRPFRPLA